MFVGSSVVKQELRAASHRNGRATTAVLCKSKGAHACGNHLIRFLFGRSWWPWKKAVAARSYERRSRKHRRHINTPDPLPVPHLPVQSSSHDEHPFTNRVLQRGFKHFRGASIFTLPHTACSPRPPSRLSHRQCLPTMPPAVEPLLARGQTPASFPGNFFSAGQRSHEKSRRPRPARRDKTDAGSTFDTSALPTRCPP